MFKYLRPLFSYHLLVITLLFSLVSCRSLKLKESTQAETIKFAGYQWEVKSGNYRQGPGNNRFSKHTKNVRVDWRGFLHLNIVALDSLWYSAEVICKEASSYGRYEIVVQAELSELDPYSVLGFFTWDPKSHSEQANSEIDIEFSKWGFPLSPSLLYYTVHPISRGKLNLERMYKSPQPSTQWNGISTHIIEWRDTSITWSSYLGKEAKLENRTDYFHYSFRSKKRKVNLGEANSSAISVPQPGDKTSARLNYWLLGGKDQPFSGACPEIIIRDFSYQAY